MDTDSRRVTPVAKAHNGKVIISAEIPVSGDAEDYVVTIDVAPKASDDAIALDKLYGALADAPLPEVQRDGMPEARDEL